MDQPPLGTIKVIVSAEELQLIAYDQVEVAVHIKNTVARVAEQEQIAILLV
jgi:hypothetical protein